MNDFDAEMSPWALFNWLTCVLYQRRSKMDPVFNTIIVAGAEHNHADAQPLLGSVNLRGVAYTTNYLSTGMGAMLVRQTMENEFRAANGAGANKDKPMMSKDAAVKLMRACVEVLQYRDCTASPNVRSICLFDFIQFPVRSDRHQLGDGRAQGGDGRAGDWQLEGDGRVHSRLRLIDDPSCARCCCDQAWANETIIVSDCILSCDAVCLVFHQSM